MYTVFTMGALGNANKLYTVRAVLADGHIVHNLCTVLATRTVVCKCERVPSGKLIIPMGYGRTCTVYC